MQNVTVYTKNNCVQCMMTKKTLAQYGVSYVEKNVEEDEAALTFLKDQGYQAVPVVFTNEQSQKTHPFCT
ncbi:NrdH-redoxin [Weissella confusa]|uniref:NrdH-redoxin n=1 Tax=Weissella confusa TaxID=1583 RepID=A0A923SQ09_WEICO|nr:NrdH-redoxin [Weissella confusa]